MEQASLVLNTSKGNPRLKDLYMRPIIGTRRFQVSMHVLFAVDESIIPHPLVWWCVSLPPRPPCHRVLWRPM